ncbi:MAG: SURF1 family protein [Actinomycetota bacterium]|nr:SURF1 family protein [Nocardioidaceae bacterium]MDQ3591497.1 SURF1 family protein [Actinomycetota bacterium]
MYRFLLTRRWLALAAVAIVVAVVCARLGLWQLHRLDERRADNAIVEANRGAAPVPITQQVPVGGSPSEAQQWRTVSLTGHYAPDEQLLLRYQNRDALRGVDVVVPMLLADGSAVLVDRGFFESPAGTPDPGDVPAPPTGQVEVTGWLRVDSDAPAEAAVPSDGTVRAVVASALAGVVDAPLRGGWVQATEESPAGEPGLLGPEPPEVDMGPHFFYALQWFLFGFLAVLAYAWFAFDEAHPDRRTRASQPSVVRQAGRP